MLSVGTPPSNPDVFLFECSCRVEGHSQEPVTKEAAAVCSHTSKREQSVEQGGVGLEEAAKEKQEVPKCDTVTVRSESDESRATASTLLFCVCTLSENEEQNSPLGVVTSPEGTTPVTSSAF